jgi:hypothetical protein
MPTEAPETALPFWSRTLPEICVTVCGRSGPLTVMVWLVLLDSRLMVAVIWTVTCRLWPGSTEGAVRSAVNSRPSPSTWAIWLQSRSQSIPAAWRRMSALTACC